MAAVAAAAGGAGAPGGGKPATMEDTISMLVDTITQVLLVFEEAAVDTKKQVQVGATEQVGQAVGFLVAMAQKIATYIDPEFKPGMESLIAKMSDEQRLIASFAGKQLQSHEAEQIHACIKRLLDQAVKMMALNDKHQVRATTNTGKMVAELLARLSKVTDVDQLTAVGKEAVPLLANLKELFVRRERVVANPLRLTALQRSIKILESHSVLIIECSRDCIADPDDPAKNRAKIDAYTLLIKAIFEGMDVVEATSQFLQSFDVEFFFPGGGGYRKPIDPLLAQRIGELAGSVADALKGLQGATAAGDAAAVVMHAQKVADGMREAMRLARELAAQMEDPVKKAALLEAANALEWIAPELLQVTKELLKDPTNAELQQRQADLMEKANHAMAMVKLAADVGALEPLFAELFQAIAKGDEAAARAAAEKVLFNIEEQIATGRELAEATNNELLKQRILDAVGVLESEKGKLMPAVVKAVRNPADETARAELQAVVNNLAAASTDLADAAIVPVNQQELPDAGDLPVGATAAEREAVELAHAMHDVLDRLLDAVRRCDKVAADAAMREFMDQARQQAARAREIAKTVRDPAIRADLLSGADALDRLVPELERAVQHALANPDDKEAQHKVKLLVQQCKDESAKISNAAVRAANERVQGLLLPEKANATERQAAELAHSVFSALDDLWDAVLKGDVRRANEALERFTRSARDQVAVARKLAAECEDPELKRQLEQAADNLENAITIVEHTARAALENPDDMQARAALAEAIKTAKGASADISELAVKAANARIAAEAEKARLAEIARREAEERRAREAAEAARRKAEAEQAAAAKAKAEAEARRLAEEAAKAEAARIAAEKAEQERLAAEARRKIDERVPAHLARALETLHDDASRSRFGPDTPQGKLIAASQSVADLLQEFSLAAENFDKAGMIAAAQQIVRVVKDVEVHAKAIAADCRDERLTQQLLNVATGVQNYAQQVKLIAAVKTHTRDDISAAKGQLYAGCKHIAESLSEAIRNGESCSLRPKGSGGAAMAARGRAALANAQAGAVKAF